MKWDHFSNQRSIHHFSRTVYSRNCTYYFNIGIAIIFIILHAGCAQKTTPVEPGGVIREFYQAKSWYDRKAFIYDVQGLTEDPGNYYSWFNYDVKIDNISQSNWIADSIIEYKVTYSKGGEKDDCYFIVRKLNGVEKIDMKAMIGFSDVALKEYFKIKRNGKDSKSLKVRAEVYFDDGMEPFFPGSTGNWIYLNSFPHICIGDVLTRDKSFPASYRANLLKNEQSLHDYAELKNMITGTQKIRVMLEIKDWFPTSREGIGYLITDFRLISKDWIER